MKIFNNISETIGNTPLVRVKVDGIDKETQLLAKLEFLNPLGSVKDRPAHYMIKDGEERGLINPETLIVEPTSGNTGIGLAFICGRKNYRLRLVMPDTMSIERQKLLKHLGAELILTEGSKGMNGAIEKALDIKKMESDSFMPNQFANFANVKAHMETTAVEILNDTDNKVDMIVSGVGTGGTITGVSKVIKEINPYFKSIAVEPYDSPVLSGGKPGPHKIQGIGAGFVPEILDTTLIDNIEKIKNEESFEAARFLSRKYGILCGISSGAAFHAAVNIAKKPESLGKKIVVILPSTGERYLSTNLFLS